MVWVITSPAARATPKEIRDFFVTLEIAFAIGDRIIKPESQLISQRKSRRFWNNKYFACYQKKHIYLLVNVLF